MNRRWITLILTLLVFLLSPAYTLAKKGKDTSGPTVTLAMPLPTGNNGWYNEQVFISVQAYDPSGIKSKSISLGGATWYSNALVVRQDGTFMVIGRATDKKGNTSSVREIIHVDLTEPVVEFEIPEANGNEEWYLNPLRISLAGEDNLSGVFHTNLIAHSTFESSKRNPLDLQEQYLLPEEQDNGQHIVIGNEINEKWAVIEVRESGSYVVSGYVEDIAGNRAYVEKEILLDVSGPQVSYRIPRQFSGDIKLTGSLMDDESGISQMWLNKGSGWEQIDFDLQEWQSSWDTYDLTDGDHEIKVMVSDKAGNLTRLSYPVTVVNNMWVIYALCGILISFSLVAMFDPRRNEINELTLSIARYARMDYNARHMRKEV